MMHWGLIPSWAKDGKIGAKMINARAETVSEKPAFRSAFKARRCLIVADGFYGWQKVSGGAKQPFWIPTKDETPFAFAELWEAWKGPDGKLETCTTITTEANEVLTEIHGRMPVMLDQEQFGVWLNPERQMDELQGMLRPYPDDGMVVQLVSTRVSKVCNDDPDCIQAVEG